MLGTRKWRADWPAPRVRKETRNMSANSMNRVFLMGNLTRDPALRRTPAGSSVADIGLAVSEGYTNKEGERVEQPCFVDVGGWNKQADVCGQYLQKGSAVMVEGRLHF